MTNILNYFAYDSKTVILYLLKSRKNKNQLLQYQKYNNINKADTMRIKTLNMNHEIDQKILLEYFFKKPETLINKAELSKLSCICYEAKEQKLYPNTKRFINELAVFENQKISQTDVNDTLKKNLDKCFKVHEELVRCDLDSDDGIDHFYIAVIGVDFFQVESKFRK